MVENFQIGEDHGLINIGPILNEKAKKISIVLAANTSLFHLERYLQGSTPEG